MRNIFTKTPDNFNGFFERKEEENQNMEPRMDVLMFISQFAKVYYVEREMRKFTFSTPIILN
jgi:hypothetical protein